MSQAIIRPLTHDDVDAFRALRLAALATNPDAFSASIEEEAGFSDAEMAARAVPAPPSVILGAFAGSRLVGMAGYIANTRLKMRHKAMMVGVYVSPKWRAEKLGRRLVEAVVDHAASLGVILQCTVSAHNAPARNLYLKLGFVPYGLERDALLVDGKFYDEELLALDLRRGSVRGREQDRRRGVAT